MNDTINIYELFTEMSENKILMIYQGMFDQEVIKSMISMTEKKLIQDNIAEGTRRKLFNVMVEGLQNVCKHQLRDDLVLESPVLVIGREEGCFNLVTGNPIDNSKIDMLTKKIDHINSLNAEELKEFYKEARLNSTISEVGGAGLGFIDMARKSGNKLGYRFYPISPSFSFFILNSKVCNN